MEKRRNGKEILIEIYEEFFPKIYNYIYYLINNNAVCDDLVSSVFMKVVENIDKFDEQKASFSTWIYTIARNTVIDYYRKAKIESDIDDYVDSVKYSLSFEDAYREYTQEYRGSTEALMAILNEKERPVIYLRYFEGLSFTEIGSRLGKNSSTVRTLHERALKKMFKYLQDKGICYEDII